VDSTLKITEGNPGLPSVIPTFLQWWISPLEAFKASGSFHRLLEAFSGYKK